MIKGPLPDRLEYAILKIVAASPYDYHQNHWGGWESEVGQQVLDCTRTELLAPFKRLWNGGSGALRLTKPDTTHRHALDYSGDEADEEAFFFTGQFNAVLTAPGRSYWGGLRLEKKKAAIGFNR
jgi:hypothetical protein